MFNKIKELRILYDELNHLHIELAAVRKERDELRQANAGLMLDKRGAFRRIEALNKQIIEREKDALAATEKLKRQEYENGLLRDQLERQTCPADCKHHSNPNACRPCSRYPHARDKYETEEKRK